MRRALFRDEPVQLAQIWVLPHDVDWRQDWRRPSPLAARWRRSGEGGSMAIKREAPLAARWRGREHGMQSSVRLELDTRLGVARCNLSLSRGPVLRDSPSGIRRTTDVHSSIVESPGVSVSCQLGGAQSRSQGWYRGTSKPSCAVGGYKGRHRVTKASRLQGFKARHSGYTSDSSCASCVQRLCVWYGLKTHF